MTTRLLLVVIGLFGVTPFVTAFSGQTVRKDKAAAVLYGGMLGPVRLIADADSANMIDIVILRIRGERISDPAVLQGRPCYGIALFTHAEWSKLPRDQRKSEVIDPQLAATRLRFFPGVGALPPVVHALQDSAAWISTGALEVGGLPIPLQVPASAAGCVAAP